MERIVVKYRSAAEAEKADKAYYLGLTAQERMAIFFELLAQGRSHEEQSETAGGFPRVHKIVKRQPR
jgi:hypothetical protein